MYLLDTNVLRAFDGKAQNQCVNKWFREELNENDIHFCASVIMEQRKGIEKKRKTHPKEAEEIEAKLRKIITTFADRILPIDVKVAEEWGKLLALKEKSIIDRSIAATAKVHGLVVVTLNDKHYKNCGVRVLNPSHADPEAKTI